MYESSPNVRVDLKVWYSWWPDLLLAICSPLDHALDWIHLRFRLSFPIYPAGKRLVFDCIQDGIISACMLEGLHGSWSCRRISPVAPLPSTVPCLACVTKQKSNSREWRRLRTVQPLRPWAPPTTTTTTDLFLLSFLLFPRELGQGRRLCLYVQTHPPPQQVQYTMSSVSATQISQTGEKEELIWTTMQDEDE